MTISKHIYQGLFIWIFFLAGLSYGTIVPDSSAVKPVEIPQENIKNYQKQEAFNYVEKSDNPNFIVRVFDWLKRKFYALLEKIFRWLFGIKTAGKYLRYFLKVLPYFAVMIFAYLIFRFMVGIDLIKTGKTLKKNPNKVYLSEDERIIHEENLQTLIDKAVRNKQYRLAVRYYYLQVLKQLMDSGVIEWHNEKTNRDYVRELAQSKLASYFKNLTFIYDYVWYGNYNPAEKEFKEIEKDFLNFQV